MMLIGKLIKRLVPILILVSISTLLIQIAIPSKSFATSGSASWSWTDSEPIVFSLLPSAGGFSYGICDSAQRFMDVAGETLSRLMCIKESDAIKFGSGYYSNEGFRVFVSVGYDEKMYKLNGICSYYDSCLYLPKSDVLVTKQYLINGLVRSLVIYKNFTKRLTPVFSTLARQYEFDSSNPDYIFKNSEGYAWPIGGMGASDDGKWVGIELRQRGIGILNVDSLTMKRVSSMAYSYGTGYDPSTEFAVSNGGKQVSFMGLNSGLNLIDVSDSCGDIIENGNLDNMGPLSKTCVRSFIDPSKFIDRFYYATKPKFSADGGGLSFHAFSYTGVSRAVELRAAGYGGLVLDYLALGDSFSSGEGEIEDKYYNPGTNNDYEKCHVSVRSYPYLIAGIYNINFNSMKSVACSGAKTADIVGSDTEYGGQGGRLGVTGLGLDDFNISTFKKDAIQQFIPGRTYQSDFVNFYKPKVITVGVGGNDVGFIDKLVACTSRDTCSWAGTAKGKEMTALEIKSFYKKLVNTYQEIHEKSPGSHIYAVGYPKIINTEGKCSLLIGEMFDKTEREFMNEGVSYLNRVIEAAAKNVGIKYIDIEDSYGDSVLCGSSKTIAMNGVKYGNDSSPIKGVNWLKIIGQESFHPNNFGHKHVSDYISNSVGNIFNYSYCVNGETTCPIPTEAPEPSNYWIPEIYHGYPSQKIAEYVFSGGDDFYGKQKQLTLARKSLQPNSSVSIEITSEPKILGQFNVDDYGALDVSVDLPADLEEGYHTIHLYGNTYSGEPIELYQVIEYRSNYKPNENQIVEGAVTNVLKNASKPSVFNKNDDSQYELVLGQNTDPILQPEYEINTADKSDVKGVSIKNNTNNGALVQPFLLSGLVPFSLAALAFLVRLYWKRLK